MVAEVVSILAVGALVVFVAWLVSMARSAERSSRHRIETHDDGFRCACGQWFETEDAALSHAERRRDEVGPPEEFHPPLGVPHR